jgi:3',5'-cyclic AMP phosphodiesterase CpdA
LGNHEYGYNVSAVVAYADISSRWVMDARYYTRRVQVGTSGSFVSFLFLDTTPCVADYRADDPYWWDPCGSSYPTCSLTSSDDDFEGECQFHANVLAQDCQAQLAWFEAALEAVPEEDWLVVAGHHPIDEVSDSSTPLGIRAVLFAKPRGALATIIFTQGLARALLGGRV